MILEYHKLLFYFAFLQQLKSCASTFSTTAYCAWPNEVDWGEGVILYFEFLKNWDKLQHRLKALTTIEDVINSKIRL